MRQVNDLLTQRTAKGEKKGDSPSKMAAMARQSASGHLTSFSGVFSVAELSGKEKEALEALLKTYSEQQDQEIARDLADLISLTSEVKAINNQAALLHGERIKKAHQILTRYRDGAFTEWLKVSYGNRQTPYNFLQYYEFHQALSLPLRLRLEEMPRQAVYTLASRNAPIEQKLQLVSSYKGETKAALLETIRQKFPLEKSDNRRIDYAQKAFLELKKSVSLLEQPEATLSAAQKKAFKKLLEELQQLLDTIKTF